MNFDFDFLFENYPQAIFPFLGALAGYFFGDFDGFIHALITLVILDYITGILAAIIKHELSSQTGFKGIARKITIFLIVGLAHVVDKELLGGTALLRDAAIFFYLANEGLSILENAIKIGIPIPDIMKEKFLSFREQNKNISEIHEAKNIHESPVKNL